MSGTTNRISVASGSSSGCKGYNRRIRQDTPYASGSRIDDLIKDGCSIIMAQNYCRDDLITPDSRFNCANYIDSKIGTLSSECNRHLRQFSEMVWDKDSPGFCIEDERTARKKKEAAFILYCAVARVTRISQSCVYDCYTWHLSKVINFWLHTLSTVIPAV